MLSLVESVEGFCAEFDGGGDMQQVRGSDADGGRDFFGEGLGASEGGFRKRTQEIGAGFNVEIELAPGGYCLMF